ncbi:MAG: hypothetical protein B6242_02925 [Anaerolineaceae bacterium 4572_78]|nr:MAG: hypothetical protein B6242_02925 [Anaerolineaceae bacterium 4572_78]
MANSTLFLEKLIFRQNTVMVVAASLWNCDPQASLCPTAKACGLYGLFRKRFLSFGKFNSIIFYQHLIKTYFTAKVNNVQF